MCGINGFNFVNEDLIRKMNESTKHRGSDDDGFFISKNWSIGHNRLSIVDLSENGHQPMFNRNKSLAIIFNGEIYNFKEIKKELLDKGYKFFSKTDTEVILYSYEEWGKDCLKKFNGMFAFAILDLKKEEIFLARDRIGIKPLYYYNKNGKFIFSSEIKAILEHDIQSTLNLGALNIYFRFLYIPSPLTIFSDIHKLPLAHCASIKKNGDINIEKYWEVNSFNEINNKEEIKEGISSLLKDSIKKRTMSDRSVGVFLSGGIDSTIVAGVMSELSSNVNTFSIGYEETEESEKYNNDFYVARKTAKHFKTNHREYILSADDIKDNLEKTIYHMDEPVSNHVQTVNMLLAKFATEHVKVVLGGDGGDELFGGYERYYYSHFLDCLQKIPEIARKNSLSKFLFSSLGKNNLYEKLNCPQGADRYLSFFSQKEDKISSFLRKEYNRPKVSYDFFESQYFNKIDSKNFTQQFMLTDLSTWMSDESLLRSDKMSMAYGLEQRVPFLDHRLVEYAFRIPIKYKLGKKSFSKIGSSGKSYQGKVILKEAMSSYLPDFVLNQPKWGWFSPAAKWTRGGLNSFIKEVISPSYCEKTKDIFNFDAIDDIINKHVNKEEYALNTIWSIMTFQIWSRKFSKNIKL